jgi:8-oxo-dGTP pyrophosphatase MutT (NUDIX family)
MTHGDGDGWVGCDQDHRHWGRHGAAGLLIWAPDDSGRPLVLLIRRAGWSHHGDTWGPPGGARDSHETPAEAAVREAAEECGAPAGLVRISALLDDDHGGWSYQTLIGQAAEPFTVRPSREATETAWIPADDVASLRKEGFKLEEIFELSDMQNRVNSAPFLLTVANKAPHPNAARIFVNWLSGKDALETYSRNYDSATLRTDVDESFLDPRTIPHPGVTYPDDTDLQWVSSGRREAAEKVRELLKGVAK